LLLLCLRSGSRLRGDDGQIGTNVLCGALHDVERRDRTAKTPQFEFSKVFELDDSFHGFGDAAADQDLTILGPGTKPGGEVACRADGGVAGAV